VTKPRGPGRPSLPARRRRDDKVTATLTTSEKRRLRELSEPDGMSALVAQMIRWCLSRPDGEWRNTGAA